MENTQESTMFNRADRDMLIILNTKVDALTDNFKDIKDGFTTRLAVLEAKVIIYDQVLTEYAPSKLVPMLYAHEKWISEFKLTWRVTLALAIGIGSFITFILTSLLAVFHIISFTMPK